MSFPLALQSLGTVSSFMTAEATDGAKAHALRYLTTGGQFPVPTTYLSEVRSSASHGGANLRELSLVLAREPITALRLLAKVNGSFYGGAREVISLQEALHQFGVQQLPEIVEGFSKPVPIRQFFRGRGTVLVYYEQILASLVVAESILSENAKLGVHPSFILALLAGVQVGGLGLALARPNVHAAFLVDTAYDEKGDPAAPWRRVFGSDATSFSVEVLREMGLPKKFLAAVEECAPKAALRSRYAAGEPAGSTPAAVVSYVALRLARELYAGTPVRLLQEVCTDLARRSGFTAPELIRALQKVVSVETPRSTILTLPQQEKIRAWSDEPRDSRVIRKSPSDMQADSQPFMLEIKATLGMPMTPGMVPPAAQAVLSTLQALVFGIGCQRAIFFRHDAPRNLLISIVAFGREAEGGRGMLRRVGEDRASAVDVQAVIKGEPTFTGEGIFKDGWPAVAFPVVWGGQVLGVFYGDFEESEDSEPLETAEQLMVMALAEPWQRVPDTFCEVVPS